MTKIYSKNKIEQLKSDRTKGYTITELCNKFNIPKTSLWHHIKDIQLSYEASENIRHQRGGSHKRMLKRIEIAKDKAESLYIGKDWHQAVVLSMLYWAEGSKKDFCFTNTDTEMIKLFIGILKRVFHVSKEDLYVVLRITDDMNESKCLKYWSKEISIPMRSFKVRTNDGIRKMNSEYGICKILVRKGRSLLKLINAILEIEKERIESL